MGRGVDGGGRAVRHGRLAEETGRLRGGQVGERNGERGGGERVQDAIRAGRWRADRRADASRSGRRANAGKGGPKYGRWHAGLPCCPSGGEPTIGWPPALATVRHPPRHGARQVPSFPPLERGERALSSHGVGGKVGRPSVPPYKGVDGVQPRLPPPLTLRSSSPRPGRRPHPPPPAWGVRRRRTRGRRGGGGTPPTPSAPPPTHPLHCPPPPLLPLALPYSTVHVRTSPPHSATGCQTVPHPPTPVPCPYFLTHRRAAHRGAAGATTPPPVTRQRAADG